MNNTFYVYALSDPRSMEVIYIGKAETRQKMRASALARHAAKKEKLCGVP
jgi:hypothetical protein